MDVKIMAFLLNILATITLQVHALASRIDTSKTETTNYALLVDAGSTSSKIKLYRWAEPLAPDLPPFLLLDSDKRFKPSLSSFQENTHGLVDYLKTMLNWAKHKVPQELHHKTPIYLLGTAGMRYLDAKVSGNILKTVRKVLSNSSISPFSPVRGEDVDILSGEEEAIYGWIAINYLIGFFNGYRPLDESVGLLEMGGGSTQIAFIPRDPIYSEEFQVRFAGKVFSVYVQSFLQMGGNGIKTKVANVLRQRSNTTQMEDPCSLQGDESTITFADGSTVHLRGTSSPEQCLEILATILRPAKGMKCQPKPCSIGGVYQPSVENITFYATQAYGYAPRNLEAVGKDGVLDMSFLLQKVTNFCRQSLDEALKNPKISAKFASADCLMGLYVPSLLRSYGFSVNTDRIRMTSNVKNLKIDWAMGAMLVKLSDRFSASLHQERYSVNCTSRVVDNHRRNSAPSLKTNNKSYKEYLVLLCLVATVKNWIAWF